MDQIEKGVTLIALFENGLLPVGDLYFEKVLSVHHVETRVNLGHAGHLLMKKARSLLFFELPVGANDEVVCLLVHRESESWFVSFVMEGVG